MSPTNSSSLRFKMRDLVLAATAGAIIMIIIFMSTTLSSKHESDDELVPEKREPTRKDSSSLENGGEEPTAQQKKKVTKKTEVDDEVLPPPVKSSTNDDLHHHEQQQQQGGGNDNVIIESSSKTKNDPTMSSEPEDPVYHNNYPLPLKKKILKKPPKLDYDGKSTSKAAENMFVRFEESFDRDKLYKEGIVVPAMISPTFHDGDVLRDLLESVTVPVRHLIFICNADDERVTKLLKELAPLEIAGGMTVFKFNEENRGFAKSINLGMRRARQVLLGYSEFAFLPKWDSDKLPLWYAPINCDAVFRPGAWEEFTKTTNRELKQEKPDEGKRIPGLFYGHVVDHYAFGVSDAAIRRAGYFDEVFFPAYMEDIDFKWRIHNAGFRTIQITSARIDHHQSINLKRSSGASPFKMQMHRGGLGFEYGWMKWGYYEQHHTRQEFPPSGRKTPFGIDGFPLHLWKIDPTHRNCIITAQGVYFQGSSTCWYNGTGLLKSLKKLNLSPPNGEQEWRLPRFLVEPTVSMRDYLQHGSRNNRKD